MGVGGSGPASRGGSGPANRGGQIQLTGGGGVRSSRGGGGQPRQDNIGSICYTAGGMPLAFTQEDFLYINFSFIVCLL